MRTNSIRDIIPKLGDAAHFVNVPHNLVKNENQNRSLRLSADQLLGSVCEGQRADYQALRAFDNIGARQETALSLLRPMPKERSFG